jgi:hypothetical protein
VGKHSRLARSRARNDQQRTALMDDGLALLGVEALEEGVGIEALPGRPLGRTVRLGSFVVSEQRGHRSIERMSGNHGKTLSNICSEEQDWRGDSAIAS